MRALVIPVAHREPVWVQDLHGDPVKRLTTIRYVVGRDLSERWGEGPTGKWVLYHSQIFDPNERAGWFVNYVLRHSGWDLHGTVLLLGRTSDGECDLDPAIIEAVPPGWAPIRPQPVPDYLRLET